MGIGCSKTSRKNDIDSAGEEGFEGTLGLVHRSCSVRYARQNSTKASEGLQPGSLLDLAARTISTDIARYPAPQILQLPGDLAQKLLDELLASGNLDYAQLNKFRGQVVYSVCFDGYPGVNDEWLAVLDAAPLESVSLAHCEEVTDRGLCKLQHKAKLRRLILDHCVKVTDLGLINTRGFGRLRELSLRGCDSLTSEGLEHVANCTALVTLNLELCTGLSRLDPLAALVNLECLDLGWCSGVRDEDVGRLARLTRLTQLQLSKTQVGDAGLAQGLAPLVQLRVLGLAGLGITARGVPALEGMQQLRDLNLAWCLRLSDEGFAWLAHLPSLERLDACYSGLSDVGLLRLTGLTALRDLNLDSCRVTDRGLAALEHLSNLERLDLSDCSISSEGLERLHRCRRLAHLNLSYTDVPDAAVPCLSPLRALSTLNLDSRLITDQGVAALVAAAPGLKELDLFGAQMTDKGCAYLRRLQQVERLELCGGLLSNVGVAHLACLRSLRSLNVAHNCKLDDGAVPFLNLMTGLVELNLSDSSLGAEGLLHLTGMESLQVLTLNGVPVKPHVLARLRTQLPSLHTLKHKLSGAPAVSSGT